MRAPLPTHSPIPAAGEAGCDTARMLDRLRNAAMANRLCRREASEAACARLQSGREADFDSLAAGLMRTLPDALGRRVVMHRPGARTLSFDEAWLMRMLGATATGDDDTLHFALATRVRREMRRPLRVIAGGLARHLEDPPEITT